jgi:hypothetical protein
MKVTPTMSVIATRISHDGASFSHGRTSIAREAKRMTASPAGSMNDRYDSGSTTAVAIPTKRAPASNGS